jgi:putative ABC transport system permease protein
VLAWKELRRRPIRTVLTACGVAAGVTSYLLLVGSAQGLSHQYRAAASYFGADIVVQQAGVTSVWGSAIAPDDVAALRRIPGVGHVSRIGLGKTKLVGSPFFLVFGLDPAEPLIGNIPLQSGRRPRQDASEMLLGVHASTRLRMGVGGTLDVRGRAFRVSGIYGSGMATLDAGGILGLPATQQLFNLQQAVNVVFLDLTGEVDAGTVVGEIAATLPRLDAVLAGGWSSTFGHVALVDSFARFLASLAVLLAALGVAVVLQMSAVERTAELAVLRAIGWSRGRVVRLVLAEAFLVTLLGFALATLFSELTLALVRSSQLGYTAPFLPPHLSARVLAEGLAVAVVAGSLGSLAPLIWAVRVAPARALRSA